LASFSAFRMTPASTLVAVHAASSLDAVLLAVVAPDLAAVAALQAGAVVLVVVPPVVAVGERWDVQFRHLVGLPAGSTILPLAIEIPLGRARSRSRYGTTRSD
jgi:hypothetical protein